MIQTTGNADDWLENNGFKKVEDVNPFEDDFYINVGELEKTEFLYLAADATRQHTEAIKANNQLNIIGSGIPEIFWPGLATGNHASTDVQKDLGISCIHGLRRELNRSFTQLFNQTLTIRGFTEQTRYSEVKNDWDQFEMVSKETQAKIFQMFTQGLGNIIQNASMGYDDIQYFINKFYPDMPEKTRKKLMDGMSEMAEHTLKLKGDVYSTMDIHEPEDDTEPKEGDSTEGDGDELEDDVTDIEAKGGNGNGNGRHEP
jgi:hypothetical protein